VRSPTETSPLTGWRQDDEGGLVPFLPGREDVEVVWTPQPGSQQAFLECPVTEALFEGPRGGGKGLPLDEPVLTPVGFRRIGDLKVGSPVCAHDGTVSTVVGVFPQGQRPTYEIEFDDGAIARCDDQHIWPARIQGYRIKRGFSYKLMTMPEVLRAWRAGRRVHVPTLDAVAMVRAARQSDWPVDPYLLGLLLGGGSMNLVGDVWYCTVDNELARAVLDAGFKEYAPDKRDGLRTFGISRGSAVRRGLSKLGLLRKPSWERRVPELYLVASAEARLALLQGLLDTDGYIDARGHVDFSSSSVGLAEDVVWLVRSLGGKATLSAHRVYIQTGDKFAPFRLQRKASRVTPYQHDDLVRRIVAIRELGPQETVCIKVDHPLGLFITRDFVVTHNTDALLMDYAQDVGKGLGGDWRGILFRRTYAELRDVVEKSTRWFPRIFRGKATWNESKYEWKWSTGESLRLAHAMRIADYWHYHGAAFGWIGWEELTTWPNDQLYTRMFSCLRSANPKVRQRVRSTTNPAGIGHSWVKARFGLPVHGGGVVGPVIRTKGQPARVAIRSRLEENKILLRATPDYLQNLRAQATDPELAKAWIEGSWDIVIGGMFSDLWTPSVHVIPPVPVNEIPATWRLDRSFDHGLSAPFSVGWWAQSNGEPIRWQGRQIGEVRGDLIRVQEWYGWNGKPNQGLKMAARDIARGIVERETRWGVKGRVKAGPADTQIWNSDPRDPKASIATEMAKHGVSWERADKGPNSRKQGWSQLRDLLAGARPNEAGTREHPGLFISSACDQFLRTFPVLSRNEKDPDEVDDEAEDHIADETRYRCRRPRVIEKAQPHLIY
jgi:hypothetical protein